MQGSFCKWDHSHFSEIEMKAKVWRDNNAMHAFYSDASANGL